MVDTSRWHLLIDGKHLGVRAYSRSSWRLLPNNQLLYLVKSSRFAWTVLMVSVNNIFSDMSYGSRYTLDDVVQSMKKTGVGLKGKSTSGINSVLFTLCS